MGRLISKIVSDKSEKGLVSSGVGKLYKPENEFLWKNASPAEIHKDSLPHYEEKFERLKRKFAF